MIGLRSTGLIVAFALLAGGVRATTDAPRARAEKPTRTFEPHRILVRGGAGAPVATTVAILPKTIFTGLAKWARGAHFL